MYDKWDEQIDRHRKITGRYLKRNWATRVYEEYDAVMHGEDGPDGSVPMDCEPPTATNKYAGYPGDQDSISDLYGKEDWNEH